jgi:hypothetical protein
MTGRLIPALSFGACLAVACARPDAGRGGDDTPATQQGSVVSLSVNPASFTVGAWGRSTRYDRTSLAFYGRLDSAGKVPAVATDLQTGQIVHMKALRDTLYLLLSVTADPPTDATPACGQVSRESYLAWMWIPRFGNHPPPTNVRFESCAERTTTPGLNETADSIWLDLSSEGRHFAGHVAYDPAHPELGLRFSESPIAVAATSPAAPEPAPVFEEDDPPRPRPPAPVLRDPDSLSALPAGIRDTLRQRGCRIPQYVGDTTSSIDRGNLLGTGGRDWAIWCATTTRSRILVFRDGDLALVGDLATVAARPPAPDVKYDPHADGHGYGCIGGVNLIAGRYIESIVRDGTLARVDGSKLTPEERQDPVRDGILDGECDGASNIHYWTGKRWVLLPGGD